MLHARPSPQFLQNIWKLYLSYRRRFREGFVTSTLWNWGVVQRRYGGRVQQGPKIWKIYRLQNFLWPSTRGRQSGTVYWLQNFLPLEKNPASIFLSFFLSFFSLLFQLIYPQSFLLSFERPLHSQRQFVYDIIGFFRKLKGVFTLGVRRDSSVWVPLIPG